MNRSTRYTDPRCRALQATRIRGVYTDAQGRPVARLHCRNCGRRWTRLLRDVAAGALGGGQGVRRRAGY